MKLLPSLFGFFLLGIFFTSCEKAPSEPIGSLRVTTYYGDYKKHVGDKYFGKAPDSMKAVREGWDFLPKSAIDRKIKLGVLLPNNPTNDSAWIPVIQGIRHQQAQMDVELTLRYSDNYTAVDQHQAQFDDFVRDPTLDAILLAAIDYRQMDDWIKEATYRGKVVIGFINDVHAPDITGKVLVSSFQNGSEVAKYIMERATNQEQESLTIAFFPGFRAVGWFPESLLGFVYSIRTFPGEIKLLDPVWGSVEGDVQHQLIVDAFKDYENVDYLVGNAVAAEAAVGILDDMGIQHETHIVATYYSPSLTPYLKDQRILVAPDVQGFNIGRITLDLALKHLAKPDSATLPFRVSPDIINVDHQLLKRLDSHSIIEKIPDFY